MPQTGLVLDGTNWDIEWHVELDRVLLLPGRFVNGTLRVTAREPISARDLVVRLHGREHWRHDVTDPHTGSTDVVTSTEDVNGDPVEIAGALALGQGKSRDFPIQLPVPDLGPATLAAEDAGIEWAVAVKLDVDGRLDSALEWPVVIAQPTALLRAGVIDLPPMALFETVRAESDDIGASITLDPMPLVIGSPFDLHVELSVPEAVTLQDIRAELRVHVEATVSGGERSEVVAWARSMSPAVTMVGRQVLDLRDTLPTTPLPTVELPHGRARATFDVILARAWHMDTHLTRDVALASTAEL